MKTVADIKALKLEIIEWLARIDDKDTLSKILDLKSTDKQFKLSAEQESELGLRLQKYLRVEMSFKSWEETKNSIRKRAKHAI